MKPAAIFLMLASLPVATLAQLVPESFEVPKQFVGDGYKLVPLGPSVSEIDYKAYMSSVEHIRSTMGGTWPRADITLAEQTRDMADEKAGWDARKFYSYAVLSSDGSTEFGCVYLKPSRKAGYDAVATMWTTKEQFEKGFDAKLYADMKAWLAKSWPIQKVAWPGRDITQADWKALPRKQ